MFARGGEDGWRSGESCGWGYGLGLQSHVGDASTFPAPHIENARKGTLPCFLPMQQIY